MSRGVTFSVFEAVSGC